MKPFWVMLLLLLASCEKSPPTTPQPRPALVVTVGEKTTAGPVILIGEVRSRYESAQGFRIAGKIVQRHVDLGASVHKGQLLAKLDTNDTSLSTQAAEAEARAAEADLDLARAELDRQRLLHAKKFISDQALDIQESRVKVALARVSQSRAQAAIAGNQSDYTDLRAERAGLVTEIRAEPGQVVGAGEIIVRIAVPASKEVLIAVPESRMAGIAVDLPADVRLWANPGSSYHGKVREVAAAADSATRTFQVRIALTDADAAVRLGMTAGVVIGNQSRREFSLPGTAVTERDGQTVVWVVNPETRQVQPRPVKASAFLEEGVMIASGLNEGEQVVVAGVQKLLPGQTVQPTEIVRQP